MDWVDGFQKAVNYIEDNLLGDLDYAAIARNAHVSSSYFQRIFHILSGYTLGEYIRNRRLTLAASELMSKDCRIIDLAMKYGYDTPESFSRAFERFHGTLPSAAREMTHSLKSLSRLSIKITKKGGNIVEYNGEAKRVCVLGLGYIGLPTAALLASHGLHVTGVDINPVVVKTINDGMPTFNEPGLAELVKDGVESGCLRASHMPEEADAFIICVPTPINSDKTSNISYVESAAKSIAPVLKKGGLVVLESTSPPGTLRDIVCPILEKTGLAAGKDFYAAHVPERAAPGKTLYELVNNSRVLGGINTESARAAERFYKIFVRGHMSLTDDMTAETCKLMENTFRDVNIALANELALMCEKIGVNVWEAISLANLHPRINYHTPGPGVGGHCVAVDPWFLIEKQPELANMIRRSRLTNDGMPAHSIKIIEEMLSGIEGEKKVVIMGAAFKPDVDDIRESPILHLIRSLEKKDDIIIALYEPHVNGLRFQADDIYLAAQHADLIVLAVHHTCFKDLDWKTIASKMKTPMLYDTRNFMSPQEAAEAGFVKYRLLGNGKTPSA